MTTHSVASLDPITFQVLWSRLVSIADEMAVTLVRTAFSPAVGDGHDYACALYDGDGEMLVQSTHCTPGLIGSMPVVMRQMLKDYPAEALREGDVLICNDPWVGSGHTPDIFIGTPVFHEGRLVAFAVNAAHHIDVGGRVYSTESREVFEEGLIIPPTKLVDAGTPNGNLLRLLERNVRLPDKVLGDLRAQMAANHVGGRRLVELLVDRGLESLTELGRQVVEHTEGSMRAAIAGVPDGSYSHRVVLEEHDDTREPIEIAATVVVEGDNLTADFAGSSMQVDRPINCVLNFTRAYTVFAVKSALHPHLQNNAGVFRAIATNAPSGSILNAEFPAPVMLRTSLVYYAIEAVFGALAGPIPDKVIAPSGTYPLWIVIFSGRRDDDQPFVYIFWGNGGQGAATNRDGLSAVVFPPNTSNTPAEIFEAETQLLVESKEFIRDSAGLGRHRGGVGQSIRIRNRSGQTVQISGIGGRYLLGAPGMDGGGSGRVGRIQIDGADAVTHDQQLELRPGGAITLDFPGGGGFGDPLDRDPDAVRVDVAKNLVSHPAAEADYGVVFVAPNSDQVDEEGTRMRRQLMRTREG